jgi:predicted GNAT family N-acyltransferase
MDIKIEGFNKEQNEYFQYTLDLRSKILVQELGFDKHLEFDGQEDNAMHYIVLCDGTPVGCARWTQNGNEITIDRFCIEKSYRKRGLAIVLIKLIIEELLPSKKTINIFSTDDSWLFFTQAGFKDTGKIATVGKTELKILNFSNG